MLCQYANVLTCPQNVLYPTEDHVYRITASDYDLCGTENRCAGRLWSFVKPLNKLFHILADAFILEVMHIMTAVKFDELSVC